MIERRVTELMFAHVCHELTGPVTAINNGFELVEVGEPVPQDVRDLLVRSAKTGAQRLRFYRIAYGWLAQDAAFGYNDARALLDDFLDGGKIELRWLNVADIGPMGGRLLLNAVALATDALPRGGVMTVDVRDKSTTELMLVCTGEGARLHEESLKALAPDADVAALTPRSVHAYFAARFAEAHGGALRTTAAAPGKVELLATISAGA
jgi:histidine phosphotransferase ChpT